MGPAIDLAALFAPLRDDLGYRRIAHGIQTLERLRPEIESLSPSCPRSGTFLGLIAQWVDAGFDSPDLLVRLLERFPPAARANLPLIDYLHLRMAEGVVEMSHEDHDSAIAHFRFVQSLEHEVQDDTELLAIANFWTGRCLRKIGQYEEALTYVNRGEELALACGYLQMAAIMQATQSWLAFQKGKLDDAVAILRRAEEALRQTDDFLNRGNIQSAHGRIARRQGRYESAVQSFEDALAEYRAGGGGQLQLARTLQNLAFVKRLRALQVQKELELIFASRRSGGGASGAATPARSRIEAMRAEAAEHVEESMAIYARHNNHRGIAGGHIIRGFLRLDAGDLESAAADAAVAFSHGEEKHDYFVMARARMLQCIVENAAVEEQIGDPPRHREAAAVFARDAVSFSSHTQNRRLLARAYVWQGLTFTANADPDLDAARRCCDEATALLQPEAATRQYVWEELESLKAAVLHAAPIEPRLRAWSAGIMENTSFQQVTEEFARLVIPKVWEREGHKISRVAEKLSISPKKVRRILQSVGKLK
ncbi:MAG TPA: tetratricopeptide repeat protein [Bryobacteraceae bacterium]|nr:tetratricopeptide repeat protein [Bryobacteraceae bacterium]